MAIGKKRLGDLLLSLRLIDEAQLAKALEIQQVAPARLGSILVSQGYITEELLLNAMATQYGVWPWRLEQNPPDPDAVRRLPGQICKSFQMLPVQLRGDLLVLAMSDPHNMDAVELARNTTGLRIEPVLADSERILRAIEHYYGEHVRSEAVDTLVDQALKDFDIDPNQVKNQNAQITEEDTRPVVGLVNQILTEAIRLGASDVHIEPRQNCVEIRYRIDGQLQKIREVPQSLHPMLTTRLKIMAEIDIVEFRVPQDGRMAVNIDGRSVDLRVSVLPNHHGQRIVLRILDKALGLKTLDQIGFTGANLDLFRSLVNKPYGMFLVTGPTGSGKTTTLYAALQELKNETNNVMTCEDPIEYDIEGINQSQVHEKVGLTFARQLRAILRQDPDVILVGEIRDGETAETAIRSALTGHMVLSTLHCNDAPSALPRLFDMGVDPYLLSTTLTGVMSQRLLRTLCPHCKTERRPTDAEIAIFDAYGEPVPLHVGKAMGCAMCGRTGFKGRSAVHEILAVTPAVARMLAAREPIDIVRNESVRYGYRPMQHGALDMVVAGQTTIEEARRVVFIDAAHGHQSGGVLSKNEALVQLRAA